MKKIAEVGLAVLIIILMIFGYSDGSIGKENTDKTYYTAKASNPPAQTKSKKIEPGLIKIPNAYEVVGKTISLEEAERKTVSGQKQEPDKTKNNNVRKIDPNKPMIALTFDDGPHPRYTAEILEALKKYDGLGTFFVIGSRAEKYQNVIKSITDNGNQLGNHTYDHRELTKLSGADIVSEISRTSSILENITGYKPAITRPTYGSVNDNVRMYAGSPLIQWSIDTLDWKSKNKNKIVKQALKKVKDGDIILMHDIYKTTADAAKVIIKELHSRGYQLVTIEELYEARGINLEAGKEYFRFPVDALKKQ